MAGIGDITNSLLGAGASSLLGKIAPFADMVAPGTGKVIKTISTFATLKDLKPFAPSEYKTALYGTRPAPRPAPSEKKPTDSSALKMMNAFSDITNRIEARSNEQVKYFQQIVTRLETISSKISETNKLLELGFKQQIEYDRKESAAARKTRDIYLAEILAGKLSKTITQLRRLQIEPVSVQALQLSLTRAFAGVPWLRGLLGSQSLFYKLSNKEGRFSLLAQQNIEELSKNLYKIQQLMISFHSPDGKIKKAEEKYKKVLITKLDEVREGIISMEEAVHTIAMNIFNPKAVLGKIFWGFIGLTFARHLYLKYLSPLLKQSMIALKQTSSVIFKGLASHFKPIAAGVVGSINSFMKTVLPDSMYKSMTAMTERVFAYQKDLYDRMFGDSRRGGGLKETIQNALVGAAMKIWDMLKPFVGALMAYQTLLGSGKRIFTGNKYATGGVLDFGAEARRFNIGQKYRENYGGVIDFEALLTQSNASKSTQKKILSRFSKVRQLKKALTSKFTPSVKGGLLMGSEQESYENALEEAIYRAKLIWQISTASDAESALLVFKNLPPGREKMLLGRLLVQAGVSEKWRTYKKVQKLRSTPLGKAKGIVGSVGRGVAKVLTGTGLPGVSSIGKTIAAGASKLGPAMPAGFGMLGKFAGLLKTGFGAAAAFSPYLMALPLLIEGVNFIGNTVVPYLIKKFVGPRASDQNLSFSDRVAFMVRDIIWGLFRTAGNLVKKAIVNIPKIFALTWGIMKGLGKALFTGLIDLAKSAILSLFPWMGKWIKLDKTSEYEKWKADQEKREAAEKEGWMTGQQGEQNAGLKSLKDAFDSVKPAALVQGYESVLKIFQMTQKNMKDLNNWADQNSETSKTLQNSIISWTKAMGAQDEKEINSILDRAITYAEGKNYTGVAALLKRTKGSITATMATSAATYAGATEKFASAVDKLVDGDTPSLSFAGSNVIPGVPNGTVAGKTKENTSAASPLGAIHAQGDRQQYLKNRAGMATTNPRASSALPSYIRTMVSPKNILTSMFPVATAARITSRFGSRISPLGWGTEYHKGIDIAAPVGTPIAALTSGKVVANLYGTPGSGYNGYGNVVEILYDNGVRALYAHLQDRSPLPVGARVEQGTVIGAVGSSGYSTGPHLHLGMRMGNTWVDPVNMITNIFKNPQQGGAVRTEGGVGNLISSLFESETSRFGATMSSQQIAMRSVPVIVNTSSPESKPNIIMPITNNIVANTAAPSINTTNSNMATSVDPWNMLSGLY